MRRKLGLFNAEDGDVQLAQDFLDVLSKAQADFTLAFRRLSEAALDGRVLLFALAGD